MANENNPNKKKQIYMDYNATTPMAPEVINAINATMLHRWGNPSSNHVEGKLAKDSIECARNDVAKMISASPSDIIFVSGGTEANNLVIYSAIVRFRNWMISQSKPMNMKPHIITTTVEHDSIKLPLKMRYCIEADITYVDVDRMTESIMDNIRTSTCLITVMLANNETGIIFSVGQIARRLEEVNKLREMEGFYRILMHTDAAQAIGKVPVDVSNLDINYMTIVGHKFYGPRVGALYCKDIREKTHLYPLIYGGDQENGYRAGTENTPMIVGLGMASSLVTQNISEYTATMKKTLGYLERGLKKVFRNQVKINCLDPCNVADPVACSSPPEAPKSVRLIFPRLPNTCSISFYYPTVTGESILENCEMLMASTGAACHEGTDSTSILEHSGVCSFHARRTIRLSIGRETTLLDIKNAIQDLKRAIQKLVKFSDPLGVKEEISCDPLGVKEEDFENFDRTYIANDDTPYISNDDTPLPEID